MTGERGDVSVVVTTYDRPSFLRGAVETALGQTVEPAEVVVVDDASPTNYATETVADYPEVGCIVREESGGPAGARNTGIEATTGEYVAFLDDDDRWHRSKLERQAAALDRDPEAGLVTCAAVRGDVDGAVEWVDEVERPAGDLADETVLGNPIGEPSRVLVRRECIDDVGGFDPAIRGMEDREFFLRVCQAWPVASVDEHLVYLTDHGANLSGDRETMATARLAIVAKHEALVRRHYDWQTVLARHHTRVGRRALEAGEFRQAREALRTALGHEVEPRRLALYLASLTTPGVLDAVLGVKRALDPRLRGREPSLAVSPATFPGLGRRPTAE